jgi:hypothetical protein
VTCPTPTKKAYPERIDAMLALLAIQHEREWRGDPKIEVAAYECVCGRHHLTSQRER